MLGDRLAATAELDRRMAGAALAGAAAGADPRLLLAGAAALALAAPAGAVLDRRLTAA